MGGVRQSDRSPVDRTLTEMIASIALSADAEILAADHDFAAMARVLPLLVKDPHTEH